MKINYSATQNQIDLRRVGTIIGLPLYVDVSGVSELQRTDIPRLDLRDAKARLAERILDNLVKFDREPRSLSEEQIYDAISYSAMHAAGWDSGLEEMLRNGDVSRLSLDIPALVDMLKRVRL